MRKLARTTAIVTGAVLLGGAVFFGIVYGFICEFTKAVE